jgi:hypothetical protein
MWKRWNLPEDVFGLYKLERVSQPQDVPRRYVMPVRYWTTGRLPRDESSDKCCDEAPQRL